MAFRKALTFPTFMVMAMVVSIPFVLSSRTSLQGRTTMAENKATVAQGGMRGNGASVLTVEDSAREVPTGPDPLHHHNNPTRH